MVDKISQSAIQKQRNNKKATNLSAKKNNETIFKDKKLQKELKALGYLNNQGAGQKVKGSNGKTYTIVGKALYGRKIVKDTKGNLEVISNNKNIVLKKSYVIRTNQKAINKKRPTPQQKAINNLKYSLNTAKKSFKKQLDDDGWAGDFADGISILWNSKNRASVVRKDLKAEENRIKKLSIAAKKGDNYFKQTFKKLYGIEYNQRAIEEYNKKPTAANYRKAFGGKVQNIRTRVEEYNESQRNGAETVKTSAKLGATLVIGGLTGGSGLLLTAGVAAATDLIVEETDRYRITSGGGFRKGTNHKKILKNSLYSGASTFLGGHIGKLANKLVPGATKLAKAKRFMINSAGDVATGAAQEFAETGKISKEGVIENTLTAGVGGAIANGFKIGGKKLVRKLKKNKINNNNSIKSQPANNNSGKTVNIQNKVTYDSEGNILAAGLFSKFTNKTNSNFKYELDKTTVKSLKSYGLNDLVNKIKINKNFILSSRVKDAIDGKPLVTELDNASKLKNISNYVENGGVCSVKSGDQSKLYFNYNGTPTEIKVSKDKFEELFPPLETATFSQPGGTHVCTIQAKLNSMLNTTYGKKQIYEMFEQKGDNIIVHLRGNKPPVIFPKGQPLNINLRDHKANLFNGETPGIEMLQQAVLIDRIRVAENITTPTDISNFSLSKIIKKANENASDNSASLPLLGQNSKTYLSKESIKRVLNDEYNHKEDIMTAIWDGHARSIINYKPDSKIVVYHDPMNSGVDIQEYLEDFLQHSPSVYLNKPPKKTIKEISNPDTSVKNQTQNINNNNSNIEIKEKTIQNPKTNQIEKSQTESLNKNKTNTEIIGKNTPIIRNNYRQIAKTAEGNPINAMISGNNVVIEKNGKTVQISISELKGQGSIPVLETSTDTFLIVNMDNYGRINITQSKNPNLNRQFNNSTSKNIENIPEPKIQNTTNTPTNTNSNNAQKVSKLGIPTGYREYGKILGKRAIIGPDNKVMYEVKGTWKPLN